VSGSADFEIGSDGAGRRSDVSRKQLARLGRGEFPVEDDLDLHGLEAQPARAQLRSFLEEAFAEGLRCVRVIHGRGLHSAEGPVLRARLPEWLSQGPAAGRVLAWAPEARSRGGATLVLLRRRR